VTHKRFNASNHVLLCGSLWLGALGLCDHVSAQPQSIEAKRYLSIQGIEIVQNRDVRVVPVDNKTTVAAPDGKPLTRAVKPTQSAVGPNEVAGSSAVVSNSDQGLRDQDRLVILRQELNTELAQFQAKTMALQTSGVKEKISSEEQQRLRYLVGVHEQNIKALTAEINRAAPLGR
jgi:hypothetical protein